jgi:hypothetical protein
MTQFAIRESTGQLVAQLPPALPLGWSPPAGIVVHDLATTAGRTWEQPAPATPPTPASVGDLALRRALAKTGKHRRVIEEAIQGIADEAQRDSMIDWWDRRVEIRRDEPELRTLAGLLGMTDAQMDQAFRTAGGVQ